MSEAPTVKRVMLAASKAGSRLFRNNRGQFYTIDGVQRLVAAVKNHDIPKMIESIKRLRMVRAGIEAPGSSDLIGLQPVKITPEMVGLTLGVLLCAECKAEGWKAPKDEHEREQAHFIEKMNEFGAIAFFITDADTLSSKIQENIQEKLFKLALDKKRQGA